MCLRWKRVLLEEASWRNWAAVWSSDCRAKRKESGLDLPHKRWGFGAAEVRIFGRRIESSKLYCRRAANWSYASSCRCSTGGGSFLRGSINDAKRKQFL